MDAVFLQVLNMSLTASYVILFVVAARLFLKKAPKIFSYALWGVVLFRLVCPFSFEGLFSLLLINPKPIPSNITYAEVPQINTGINLIDHAANPILSAQMAAQGASVNPMQIWVFTGEIIWLAGIAMLLIYSIISLLRLRSKLVGAVKWRDNIYLADHIASPFVMGLLRPKIYLPSTLSEREREYIVLHEQTHIRRFDHIVKIVAFLVLTVHWFNSLVWLAFFLCVKDMEMSCDEAVMKKMDGDIRTDYSASLLSLATGRKIVAGTPLAFGEGDTKSRIKNVLNYKKPAFWVSIVAAVAVVAVIIGFVFSSPGKDGMKTNLSEIALDNLDLSANPGVGVVLAFESDRFIIFYGDFGLFGYDLENREITFAIDFIKTFGKKGSVQGEYGTGVEVSHNGRNIVLTYTDPDNPEDVQDAYFIDVPTLTYMRGEYRPIENAFSRENAVGTIRTTLEIRTTLYVRGDKEWMLFDNYISDVSNNPASEQITTAYAAAERAQAVLDSVVSGRTVAMTLTTDDGVGGGRYEVPLEYGNGRNRVRGFDSSFNWSYVESGTSSSPESVNSLKVESPDGTAALQCWQGSNLVLCTLDGESFRLSAGVLGSDAVFDGTIFTYLRIWYDEAEISGLRGGIVVPDKGQSYQEIAQAWTEAEEGAMLRATPGSKYACTYVKTTASVREDSMDSWYPAKALETEHFYFDYNTVFVPENDRATNWLMAGNTVEYTGRDAPAGALKYYLMGPMYLTEEGWRCDGIGTGP